MRWGLLGLVLLALARAASAAPLPDGGVTAQEVAKVMGDKNFPVEIGADKDGDPVIRSAWRSLKFGVFFYGCQRRPRCDSIQFSAGFDMTVSPASVARWNRTKRFGRAWLDDNAQPWVEMDMDLEHGATTEALAEQTADRWAGVIGEFNKVFQQIVCSPLAPGDARQGGVSRIRTAPARGSRPEMRAKSRYETTRGGTGTEYTGSMAGEGKAVARRVVPQVVAMAGERMVAAAKGGQA